MMIEDTKDNKSFSLSEQKDRCRKFKFGWSMICH